MDAKSIVGVVNNVVDLVQKFLPLIHKDDSGAIDKVIDTVQSMAPLITDQIGDTIDYGVVRERLQRLLKEHRLTLLESFAQTIADILIGEFGAHWVRVVVVKPRKFDDVESVGVAIERRRPVPAGKP